MKKPGYPIGVPHPNGVCCGVPGLLERPDIELFPICYTQGTVVAIALQYKHDT